MLVSHALKRSAGIGTGNEDHRLEERIEELADALVVVIAATSFLEVSQLKPLSPFFTSPFHEPFLFFGSSNFLRELRESANLILS